MHFNRSSFEAVALGFSGDTRRRSAANPVLDGVVEASGDERRGRAGAKL
jgi:hypothetical protein